MKCYFHYCSSEDQPSICYAKRPLLITIDIFVNYPYFQYDYNIMNIHSDSNFMNFDLCYSAFLNPTNAVFERFGCHSVLAY